MRDKGLTFGEAIAQSQEPLKVALERAGLDQSTIQATVESGYFARSAINSFAVFRGEQPKPNLVIHDSFYGRKRSGHIPLDVFIDWARTREHNPWPSSPPTYRVSSLREAERVLSAAHHARYREAGRMCFRGQTRHYFTTRPLPNPYCSDADGRELIILPNLWRCKAHDWNNRPAGKGESIFTTIFADNLVYRDIPDWKTLSDRNHARYGFHSMSDLEEFPDADSQEYARRYFKHKVEGIFDCEFPLLEQHYGMDTHGLDVTFDLATALFFATHKFTMHRDGTATYEPIPRGNHKGVVYSLVFEDPPLRRAEWMVQEIDAFSHISPTRPITQQCALPYFSTYGINEAPRDMHATLELDADFDTAGLPTFDILFPSPEKDPFYEALLEMKDKSDLFHKVVEYRH